MQGACVIMRDYPILIMYKEIEKNSVIFYIYANSCAKYNYINCKQLTNLIPSDAIHILTKLPYYNELYLTLKFWKILALNKLKYYNINPITSIIF